MMAVLTLVRPLLLCIRKKSHMYANFAGDGKGQIHGVFARLAPTRLSTRGPTEQNEAFPRLPKAASAMDNQTCTVCPPHVPRATAYSWPRFPASLRLDFGAHILGTFQDLRNPDCQEQCALCADAVSPCQNCFQGKPAITKCDDPSSKIFYDAIHFTTDFHLVFGESIRQCSKDAPKYDRPLVRVMCPPEEA